MKHFILFLVLFPLLAQAQINEKFKDYLVKSILNSSAGLLFETEKGLISIDFIQASVQELSGEDFLKKEKLLEYPLNLTPISKLNNTTDLLNKVSFQVMHTLSKFISFKNGDYYLTDSAKAICALLIFNDYSTSNSPYLTYFENID